MVKLCGRHTQISDCLCVTSAKIDLAKFFRNTTLLALAKNFPSENFSLYGMCETDMSELPHSVQVGEDIHPPPITTLTKKLMENPAQPLTVLQRWLLLLGLG